MGWLEFERSGSFVQVEQMYSQGFDGLEPSREVVSVDEAGEVLAEVLVAFAVEALDGCFLKGSVHAFDLAVGPGMFRLGEAVVVPL